MNRFTLTLVSATQRHQVDGVTAFVGEDPSGSFGILAGHTRTITPLVFGLARYRCDEQAWQYLAIPGGLLYFVDNHLQIFTRRFLINADYAQISEQLQQQLLAEEQSLAETRESLARMEEAMLRRLWELGRPAAYD